MRSSFLLSTALALVLTGCVHFNRHPAAVNALPAPFMGAKQMNLIPLVPEAHIHPQGPYRLNTGDRLRIVVFGQDALSNAYQVDSVGAISMPLIGNVHVAGRTTHEIEQLVSLKLKDGYVRQPHVAIEVETYRPFFIMGEVTQSGQYPFVYGMTAQTAIAISGGFSPRANKKFVEVTRRVNGSMMRAEVPLTHIVQPGDIITVCERWF